MIVTYDDYHRTVVGYHGTRLSTALAIVARRQDFARSENDDDWLGHGVYFWEHAPKQALWWAEHRSRKQQWNEPIAVLGSMIRLGRCLDLFDPQNVMEIKNVHRAIMQATPKPRKNYNHRKYLDCAVFNSVYQLSDEASIRFDSARAAYVRSDHGRRVWERSWILEDTHIQVCVRNPASILGTWLVYPTKTEI